MENRNNEFSYFEDSYSAVNRLFLNIFTEDGNKMKELCEIIDKNRVIYGAPLKEHIAFKVGGPCYALVLPDCPEEITAVIDWCSENERGFWILGNGTNVIAPDEGYEGVVIKIGESFNRITVEGTTVRAQAGALMSSLSNKVCEEGLSGLEFAGGIPGSVGGGTVMNAGAYGGELKNTITKVRALKDGKILEIPADDCEFGYRKSIFQSGDYVVLEAEFELEKGEKEVIRAEIDELNRRRREKQPLNYPSAGSTFKRPEGHFAGRLIEDCGLKGLSVGGAAVSDMHAGFVINKGGATASDILSLIELIRNTVFDRFGVKLEPEVRIIR